jgi:hypothetical protein
MATDTAEMKLARVLPVSSVNVKGTIRFREPGRRCDCPPARSARRPVVTMHASKALCDPLPIAFLFAGGAPPRPPTASARPANRQTFPWPLRAAKEPQKSRQAEHPLNFGLSPGAELQERAISVPRVILIRRPPTAPALARIERNRFLMPAPYRFAVQPMVRHVSASHAQMEGASSSDVRLRCSPARLLKLGSCSRGSLVKIVTQDREGHTIEVGGLAIRLQGLAAPERDGGVAPRQPKLCVPSCSVAAYAASSAVTARTTGRVAVSLPPSGSHRGGNGAPGSARDCPMSLSISRDPCRNGWR